MYGTLLTRPAQPSHVRIHALRTRVDGTFVWADQFNRLLLRFEHMQQGHFGMKLLAYTLIEVRQFCGA